MSIRSLVERGANCFYSSLDHVTDLIEAKQPENVKVREAKPRVAVKVVSVTLGWLSHFGVYKNETAKNYFEGMDLLQAPLDLLSNVKKVFDFVLKKQTINNVRAHVVELAAKLTTNTRDIMRSLKLVSDKDNSKLLGRVEILKSGLDIWDSTHKLKTLYNDYFKSDTISLTWSKIRGTDRRHTLKFIKNVATLASGTTGLVFGVRGKKAPALLTLGLGTTALGCVVAEHYNDRPGCDAKAS